MSEPNRTAIHEEVLRQFAQEGRSTYTLPLPLSAIDAGLAEFFERVVIDDTVVMRRMPTMGSVHYALVMHKVEIGTLRARMIDDGVTVVSARLDSTPLLTDRELATGLLHLMLQNFVFWRVNETNQANEDAKEHIKQPDGTLKQPNEPPTPGMDALPAASQEVTKTLSEPRRRGPEPKPYTVWARAQIRAGRTADEILSEYMEQRGEDPTDPDQRAKAREVLRKTLNR